MTAQFDAAGPPPQKVKLDEQADGDLFASLAQQLDRIEANIDPYGEPDLLEQWTLCIGELLRRQRPGTDLGAAGGRPSAASGKFIGLASI